MASIRPHIRAGGSTAHRVFFRLDGRQTCFTFDDEQMAETFCTAVNKLGASRAVELHRLDRTPRGDRGSGWTVESWIKHHIDHLTGVDKGTPDGYRGYLRNDIAPTLGAIPLAELSRDDISLWVNSLEEDGAAPKTIGNKHGFLSGALAAAVQAGHIAANPAAGTRLPRGEKAEMVFLTHEQFNQLNAAITEPWRPLAEFLVSSGARWGEATALRPSDVDQREHTVRISRAWKRSPYRIGPTKTKRSNRTINVPPSVLDKLDYDKEWLFTNPGRGRRAVGGPVRAANFRANVWWPAVARAELGVEPRIHDLRHTCASWLIQGGTPLPVIQRHLGHESIQTTVDVYGHLDRRSARDAADIIGKLLE